MDPFRASLYRAAAQWESKHHECARKGSGTLTPAAAVEVKLKRRRVQERPAGGAVSSAAPRAPPSERQHF